MDYTPYVTKETYTTPRSPTVVPYPPVSPEVNDTVSVENQGVDVAEFFWGWAQHFGINTGNMFKRGTTAGYNYDKKIL